MSTVSSTHAMRSRRPRNNKSRPTPQATELTSRVRIVIYVRSLLFNIGFYLSLVIHILVAIPTFVLPRRALFMVANSWVHSTNWMLRVICNIHIEYRGLENIPRGPLMIASKHQSAWETIGFLPLLRQPMYILKRELTWIPFFGWYLWKARMIPVNRGA